LTVTAVATPAARAQSGREAPRAPPPVVTQFSYSGDLVANVAGGEHHGTAYAGAGNAELTFLLGPLIGWPNARVFILGLATHGGAPSALVGDVQGVSSLQATPAVRLEEVWLQQNLLGNRLSLLAGRYDLNSEFYRLQSAALFVNGSFGMGPEFAQSGVAGPSVYPSTAVGARVAVKPGRDIVWRSAVLNGAPVNRPDGSTRLFASGDGALLVTELAFLSRPDTARGEPHNPRFRIGRLLTPRPYDGKVAVGAWHYTARFPDLVDTLASGDPVQHQGSSGAYAIADRALWSAAHGRPGTLAAFAQLGLGDDRVNQIGSYVGVGLNLAGAFPGRAMDELGLALGSARNGSHFERLHAGTDAATGGETTVELTYLAQLGEWFSLQPDLQYVRAPGGAGATRNAFVVALRIAAVSP
jgi:porin